MWDTEHPHMYAAIPKGGWKRRLEKLRKGGCNAIRLAPNPASDEFLDLCDEMGFLARDEFLMSSISQRISGLGGEDGVYVIENYLQKRTIYLDYGN